MNWIALLIEVPAEHAEALSEALMEHGAISVSIEDAAAGTPDEQPIFGEPGSPADILWARSVLRALCAPQTDIAALMREATTTSGLAPIPSYRTEEVPEQDWVRLTQAQFEPIRISARLWIVPSWHQAPDPNALALHLDPGLAFGTGSHPTTRLCLHWLEAQIHGGERVLDYGCGSGILAIAAAKLGAAEVVGVDIDPNAVEQARLNAEANAVIAQFVDTSAPLSMAADLLVANILARPLKLLAPLLAQHCRIGGGIVLAGLLDAQAEDLSQTYAPWFDMSVFGSEEGWTALQGTRKETCR
jgi:ribosomal protein L11 methyltransferase